MCIRDSCDSDRSPKPRGSSVGWSKRLRPRHEADALADLGERARGDGFGALGAGLEHLEREALVRLELADARLDGREGVCNDLAEVGLEVGVALALVAPHDLC